MPWYLAPKTVSDRVLKALADHDRMPSVRSRICVFDDPALAHAANLDATSQNVRYFATTYERSTWHRRERNRFFDGTYLPIPWGDDFRADDSGRYRFAHLSIKHPGMIAYTENDEKGHLDRQTVIKPGRYIQRFHPDFTAEQTADCVALCSADKFALKIATSAGEIEAVYTAEHAPDSCMSHCLDDYQSPVHPVRVYGDSDLALAYIGDPDTKITARAIVWPEKKLHSRIYGAEDTMSTVLARAGYTAGSMSGACVRAISADYGYVMPYVDGITGASVAHDRPGFIRLGRGSIQTRNTDGLGYDDETRSSCDRCGNDYSTDDDDAGAGLCSSCYLERTDCAECGDYVFPDDRNVFDTENGHVCRTCYGRVRHDCRQCDAEFFDCDFGQSERARRERQGVEMFCDDCADNYVLCTDCDEPYSTDEPACPTCNSHPRCEHTADLLADVAVEDGATRLVTAGETLRTANAEDIRTWTISEPFPNGGMVSLVRVVNGLSCEDWRYTLGDLILCAQPSMNYAPQEPATATALHELSAVVRVLTDLSRQYPACEYRLVAHSQPLAKVTSVAGVVA